MRNMNKIVMKEKNINFVFFSLRANDKVAPAIGTNLRLGQLPVWLLKVAEFLVGFKVRCFEN